MMTTNILHEPSMRERILNAIQDETQGHPHIHAFWEAGSPALNRADALSDLDLYFVVSDGQVDEGAAALERALQRVAPIEIRWEVPRPTWHGNWQAFYRLEGTSPYLLIDCCIFEQKAPTKFLEPEIHGRPAVFFDKIGASAQAPAESGPLAERIRQRLELHAQTAELFHVFIDKEVIRGRELDALQYYQTFTLRLVEVLRMKHKPWQYNFGLRYLTKDLPPEVYAELKELIFVGSVDELLPKKERLMALLRRSITEVRALDLQAHLEQAR